LNSKTQICIWQIFFAIDQIGPQRIHDRIESQKGGDLINFLHVCISSHFCIECYMPLDKFKYTSIVLRERKIETISNSIYDHYHTCCIHIYYTYISLDPFDWLLQYNDRTFRWKLFDYPSQILVYRKSYFDLNMMKIVCQ